ncbi:DEAD-box ATP-dependent RNA helicase 50 [Tetrabaena socialis]|uniref:DEAD-box ATP-dependent RNA helicase 50 n=1 Tax=Tetrabaena socialis TaxID=47790 RepID=A0A2J8AFW5_9CHLO|nr:DEAD-box ATP-dependent RNA helicase 50 [Tetrabaena socialis]|eukprot:PNH11413.1 DEAD-box ATP-dependent RNA helicase 50 [Tetrabaena socialis]
MLRFHAPPGQVSSLCADGSKLVLLFKLWWSDEVLFVAVQARPGGRRSTRRREDSRRSKQRCAVKASSQRIVPGLDVPLLARRTLVVAEERRSDGAPDWEGGERDDDAPRGRVLQPRRRPLFRGGREDGGDGDGPDGGDDGRQRQRSYDSGEGGDRTARPPGIYDSDEGRGGGDGRQRQRSYDRNSGPGNAEGGDRTARPPGIYDSDEGGGGGDGRQRQRSYDRNSGPGNAEGGDRTARPPGIYDSDEGGGGGDGRQRQRSYDRNSGPGNAEGGDRTARPPGIYDSDEGGGGGDGRQRQRSYDRNSGPGNAEGGDRTTRPPGIYDSSEGWGEGRSSSASTSGREGYGRSGRGDEDRSERGGYEDRSDRGGRGGRGGGGRWGGGGEGRPYGRGGGGEGRPFGRGGGGEGRAYERSGHGGGRGYGGTGERTAFLDQVEPLRAAAPPSMRFVLVTATVPQHCWAALREVWPDLRQAFGPGLHRTAPGLVEELVDCSGGDEVSEESGRKRKLEALSTLLERHGAARTMVFCNKIESCRDVENHLKRVDPLQKRYRVLPYHEAIRDELRADNMAEFLRPLDRKQQQQGGQEGGGGAGAEGGEAMKVLVATDRTSRGIDVLYCQHVVLFDFPRDPSEYVRRVGRTARGAGGTGTVSSLVLGRQVPLAREIIERNQKGMPVHSVPA